MKLYYSPGACSLGPHIVFHETGAEAELILVRVAEREISEPEYLAINPRARVPALEVDRRIYTEAAALLVYLASRNPDAGLLPRRDRPTLPERSSGSRGLTAACTLLMPNSGGRAGSSPKVPTRLS